MKDTFTEEEREQIDSDDTLHNAIIDWFYENDSSSPLM
jgi:hypothetical protein